MYHKDIHGNLIHNTLGKRVETLSKYQLVDSIVRMQDNAVEEVIHEPSPYVLQSQMGLVCTINGKAVYLAG